MTSTIVWNTELSRIIIKTVFQYATLCSQMMEKWFEARNTSHLLTVTSGRAHNKTLRPMGSKLDLKGSSLLRLLRHSGLQKSLFAGSNKLFASLCWEKNWSRFYSPFVSFLFFIFVLHIHIYSAKLIRTPHFFR